MENTTTTTTTSADRLTRSRDKIIAGVCGGLARYFKVDPAIVRLAFIVFAFAGGASIPVYIVLWIVMPLDDRTAVATIVTGRTHEALALVLIASGGVWLLANLGAFRFIDWEFAWPIVLIVIGFAVLARRIRP